MTLTAEQLTARREPQWSRQPLPCPEPGVYEGVPFNTYAAWDAVNASLLKEAGIDRLARSWAKVRHWLTQPADLASGCMYLGHAAHGALLEPEDYPEKLRIIEQITKPSTGRMNTLWEQADPEVWAAAQAEHPGCYVLSPDMAAQVDSMVAVARRHERVSKLLELNSQRELSVVWDDETTGLRCKARIDWWIPGDVRGVIVDYKSCREAAPHAFNRQIDSLGYFLSLAFYAEGAQRALGSGIPAVVLIAQEKEPPHDLRVYELGDLYMDLGRLVFRELLEGFARCYVTDKWPGYPAETLTLSPSVWMLAGYPELN